MSGKIIVETARLLLREYVPDDAEAVFELGRSPLVQQLTGDRCLTSDEEAKAVLCEHPIADYRRHGFGRWAVVVKSDASVIGFAGLKPLDELGEVDLGFRLLPEFWGRGLATEAARASIAFGFQTLRLSRILGLVAPDNFRSVRVLEKCALTFEKMVEYRSQNTAQYAIHAEAGS